MRGLLDAPLRAITSRRNYRTASHPRGTHSVELWLSCGHVEHRKGSAEPRASARCWECLGALQEARSAKNDDDHDPPRED